MYLETLIINRSRKSNIIVKIHLTTFKNLTPFFCCLFIFIFLKVEKKTLDFKNIKINFSVLKNCYAHLFTLFK